MKIYNAILIGSGYSSLGLINGGMQNLPAFESVLCGFARERADFLKRMIEATEKPREH